MPFLSRQNRILISVVGGLAVIGFGIAFFYYRQINNAEDPRILGARRTLSDYERMMREARFLEAMPLLDSIERVYSQTSGYEGSYELGVVANNRASVFIMKALYDSLLLEGEKAKLLSYAKENLLSGIMIYEHWLDSVKDLNESQIRTLIEAVYTSPSCNLGGIDPRVVIEKRVKDINFAKIETVRRLSVAYTNLGIVQRHQLQQDSAIISYRKALELWDDNHQARSNLDVLMGKEPLKRNFIQKLFPPDRHKP